MKFLINRRLKNWTHGAHGVKRNYNNGSVEYLTSFTVLPNYAKGRIYLGFLRTQRFLETYPILLFFQHNNLSVSQWKKLKTLKNCEFLVVKNSVLRNVIGLTFEKVRAYEKNEMNGEATPAMNGEPIIQTLSAMNENEYSKIKNFLNLFQGPCFVLGIKESSQLKIIKDLQNQKLPIFFVGGLLNHQILNHLDIEKWFQLDTNIYTKFLSSLNQSFLLVDTLSMNSLFSLNIISSNLINTLELIKIKLQDKNCQILQKELSNTSKGECVLFLFK